MWWGRGDFRQCRSIRRNHRGRNMYTTGRCLTLRRALGLAAVMILAGLLSASHVTAHQSPTGCTGNNLGLDLLKHKTQIVSGDTVHFTVNVRNDAPQACDVTGANATFTCPGANGSPTGASTVCATGDSFPAGLPPTTICEVDCVVTVNPGVSSAQAKAEVHGTLHDVPANDFDTADVVKFISLQIMRCGDGIVGTTPGETCDPPGAPGGGNGNICRSDCTVCGDGIVNSSELCDDGNGVDTDACANNCIPHECGDGIVDVGEQCDDGNRVDGDGCSATCQI